MKSEELMLGNYVFDDYSGEMVVRAINEDTVDLSHPKHMGVEGRYEISKLGAVPLTEQRLDRLGFKLIEDTDVFEDFHYPYYVNNGVVLLFNKTSEDNMCFKIGLGEMRNGKHHAVLSKWVKSVHEVQNFYFINKGEKLYYETE